MALRVISLAVLQQASVEVLQEEHSVVICYSLRLRVFGGVAYTVCFTMSVIFSDNLFLVFIHISLFCLSVYLACCLLSVNLSLPFSCSYLSE